MINVYSRLFPPKSITSLNPAGVKCFAHAIEGVVLINIYKNKVPKIDTPAGKRKDKLKPIWI